MIPPAQPIRRIPHLPFTGFDGLVLAGFAVLAVIVVVPNDHEFFPWMRSFAIGNAPWTSLPEWVSDLELPAKRIANDFTVFLAVMTLGVASVTFRHRAAWCLVGLPRPGVAASAAAAIVLIVHEIGARFRYWCRPHLLKAFPASWYLGLESLSIETEVAASILGVWAYLMLARGWKARDDWRDWLGRWLAWCWLSTIPFHVLSMAIWG
jgi:hypothetical protein